MAADLELIQLIEDAKASQRLAYMAGLQDGGSRVNEEWELRAAEQEAVTAAVRQHVVDLEITVQSLTQELVEALYALDVAGIGPTRLQPPGADRGLSGHGDGPLSRNLQTGADAEMAPRHGPEATDENDGGTPYGTGEHFDGVPI